MSKLMVSVSGVRGVFGESINPQVAQKFAAAFGINQGRGKIMVGRDSRTTGPAMLYAVISGLMAVGCDVVDLGIVSTPTVLLAVEESAAVGGISITASHNAAQWNAMKFVDANGMFLFPEKAAKFIASLDNEIVWQDWQNMGELCYDYEASHRHLQKILAIPYLELDKIRVQKYKVVIDSVNGAGGILSPALLAELGCEVIQINSMPTGIFAHAPEPLNKNLGQLEKAVKLHKADIGFATDPDVDRLSIVSEQGKAIGEELTLLIAEKYVLSRQKGDIVTNLSSSMASEDIASAHGVKVHRMKVGEINVGKKMMDIKAAIGGEGNGGVICPSVHYTRDAPAGMALILGYLATSGKKVSEICDEIPQYFFAKDKIEVPASQLDAVIERAKTVYPDLKLDTTDGYKYLGEDFWIHIRKSGTEPIIRVYVESKSTKRSAELCKETIDKLLA